MDGRVTGWMNDYQREATHPVASPSSYPDLVIPTQLVPRRLLCDLLEKLEPLLGAYCRVLNPIDEGIELGLEVEKRCCVCQLFLPYLCSPPSLSVLPPLIVLPCSVPLPHLLPIAELLRASCIGHRVETSVPRTRAHSQ
jgi:hypothetical protein